MPKAERILNAENHLCFCMILDNTLDIAMNYENKEETAIGNSAALLRTSFLLILIILGVFGYAFYIILKRKKSLILKRDFINNLTHEFKTPIFSISLAAKTLKERGKSQQLETLDTLANLISHEANRLKTHVDNILQIAMIDSGNFSLDKKNIDLHAAIHHVVSSFSMILHKRNGKIRLILEAQNHTVFADETHINNLLYNLIDNGQKYSEGAPDIEIMTSDHKDGIHLTIKDHGIGMDKTTQKYVFDQFYRSQQGDIHTVKGFGLGLSYVKKIVDLHKGSIHLKSDPGKGSAFTIFLPRIS
ncbi:MAG: HAMP domain-containing sensor histidine kinase [Bacteroidia bacterium]